MKRLILSTVLFATLAATASAQQPAVPTLNPRALRLVEHRLNITASQRESIKAIPKQEQPALESMHQSLAAERSEYAASAQSGSDEASSRAIAAKYVDANTNALVERQKLTAELFAVLTPEQREKVQQLRARFGTAIEERLQTLGDSL